MSRGTHILVIGHPRGGTSVLFNMLSAAWPEWSHYHGEAAAIGELAQEGNRISKRPLDSCHCQQIVTAAAAHGKQLLTIQVIRDPRDVMCSKFLRGGYAVDPNYYVDRWGRNQPSLGYLPVYYGLYEWRKTNTPLLLVRYEDLVREPATQQPRVEAFLDMPIAGLPFSQFYNAVGLPMTAGARNEKLTDSFIGRWRSPEHRAQVVSCFESDAMRATIRELKYEDNDSWYEGLCSNAN